MTHYEALGVDASADDAAIRRAYLRLALKFHPDKKRREGRIGTTPTTSQRTEAEEAEEDFAGDNTARDRCGPFVRVSEAYIVLSDPELRRTYDESGGDAEGFESDDSEVSVERYLRRFRELVVLTPQGLDLGFS